jgi:tetratricopeptide (TPR) repeat protein
VIVGAVAVLAPTSDDPVVDDAAVGAVADALDGSTPPEGQTDQTNTLIALSVDSNDQAEAQALYVAGHAAYGQDDFLKAQQCFEDLADAAPGTLLVAESERMLAQIARATGQRESALLHYKRSLAAIDAVVDAGELDPMHPEVQFSKRVVMLNLASLQAVRGDTAAALETSSRALAELEPPFLPFYQKLAHLRTAGDAARRLGDDALAITYYDEYLDVAPTAGIGDGERVNVLIARAEAQGVQFGRCSPEVLEVYGRIVGDPVFAPDPERYRLGTFMARCMDEAPGMPNDRVLALLDKLSHEAEQAADDVAAVLAGGANADPAAGVPPMLTRPDPLQEQLLREARARLMIDKGDLLVQWDRPNDAIAVYDAVAADPHAGAHAIAAATRSADVAARLSNQSP